MFFDLEDYNIYVENKTKLVIKSNSKTNIIKQHKQEKNIRFLESYFDEYPSVEKEFVKAVNNNQHIINFTCNEAEFIADKNGDMVKIDNEKSNPNNAVLGYQALAANLAYGDNVPKYYFTFATMVSRSGTKNPYTYTASSIGAWSKNSIIGGKQYPASGVDYIAQIAPNGFTKTKASVAIDYNHGKIADSKTDYSPVKGGTNYICYSVVDDPAGNNQMTDVCLTVTYSANSSSSARLISSYYVHTWSTVEIEITLGGTINEDGAMGLGLNFTPKKGNDFWQLYSFVPFKF